MEWHIITGSKGGIGKTLLTLLLLAYNLEKQESTLVLDLNGMNTDSSAMLLSKTKKGKPLRIPLQTQVPIQQTGAETIVIQKAYSLENKEPSHYVVGYPLNPFGLYNPPLFADLLATIKAEATRIAEKLKIPPLQQVIIDTNYHFCNLFGQDDTHYEKYNTGTLNNENINLWFLWVYRQLEKLIQDSREDETTIVKLTAAAIEHNLKSTKKATPFMHVFSPVALGTAPDNSSKKGALTALTNRLFNAIARHDDYIIEELKNFSKLPIGECISFDEWVEKLDMAQVVVGKRFNDDPHLFFLDTLVEALNISDSYCKESSTERPMNVIPLSIYQKALEYYTDKERDDPVAILRKFKIYRNFSELMW